MPQMFPIHMFNLFNLFILIFMIFLIRVFWMKVCLEVQSEQQEKFSMSKKSLQHPW